LAQVSSATFSKKHCGFFESHNEATMARTVMSVVLLAVCLTGGGATETLEQQGMNANPIRRIVSLLQGMTKKLSSEGEKDKELFDKFMCYCQKQKAATAKAIAETSSKDPQLKSDIEEDSEKIKQIKLELEAAKADIKSAEEAVEKATEQRKNQNTQYQAKQSELAGFVGAMNKAIPALEKGAGGAFIQAQSTLKAVLLQAVTAAQNAPEEDRESVMSFLGESADSQYAPQSGEIVGILKTIQADYVESLATVENDEAEQQSLFEELKGAKTRQAKTMRGTLAKRIATVGQLKVKIVQMKGEMKNSKESQAENAKFAAELKKNCKARETENDEKIKSRGAELIAVHDTIKILNDDDALDTFKKALPSASSLLQIQTGTAPQRKQALAILRKMQHKKHSTKLDFLQMVLGSHKVNFAKVGKMIDDMLHILLKEQAGDKKKRQYCNQRMANAKDKKRGLKTKVKDATHDMDEQADVVDESKSEIRVVEDDIHGLDKSVKQATRQRKSEHSEYVESMSTKSSAKDLLGVAKERMNKFYKPATEGSFVQISAHTQTKQACGDVVSMLDKLILGLTREMVEDKHDEEQSQKAYERLMADSAGKRKADTKAISGEEETKAEAEEEKVGFAESKQAEKKELKATRKNMKALHETCDWLLANYDLRQKSRSAEAESLQSAKNVLHGAVFVATKITGKHLRGHQ